MADTYERIDDRLRKFIDAQPVFFVATAPLSEDGHINCSPKGNRDSLVVLGPRQVAYQDLTGSGIETVAHLRENGRIVVMFCSFDGPPRIVRLHGRGHPVVPGDDSYEELAAHFPPHLNARAVVRIDVERISDSCGYGVPVMPLARHRDNLDHWAETKGPEGLVEYRLKKNTESIDGLAGLPAGAQSSTAQSSKTGSRFSK